MSRKGENIYKRKDGRWEARYIKGYGENGVAKYGYVYAQSYHEVRERLERTKVSFSIGEAVGAGASQKLSAICDEWLTINRHKIAESSYVKYFSVAERYIKPALGGIRAEAITTARISAFSGTLLTEKKLSATTVSDVLTILGSILKYAKRKFGVKMPDVEIIHPKFKKKEMRVLSLEEQKSLVKFLLENLDGRNFGIMLALMTGMRLGEICALRWENVSFEEKTINVKSTMQRLKDIDGICNTKIVISTTKSDTSTRKIPLTDYAIRLCKKLRSADAAFVLTGSEEKFCEPRMLQYRFECVTKKLGLENVHFHTLRHTFATRCVEVGFEIKSLSEILGHSSPNITLERYVHSSIALKRENMQKACVLNITKYLLIKL